MQKQATNIFEQQLKQRSVPFVIHSPWTKAGGFNLLFHLRNTTTKKISKHLRGTKSINNTKVVLFQFNLTNTS